MYFVQFNTRHLKASLFFVVFYPRQHSGGKGLRSLSNPLWIWVYSYNRQHSDSKGFFFYPPPAQCGIELDVAFKWSPLNYLELPLISICMSFLNYFLSFLILWHGLCPYLIPPPAPPFAPRSTLSLLISSPRSKPGFKYSSTQIL